MLIAVFKGETKINEKIPDETSEPNVNNTKNGLREQRSCFGDHTYPQDEIPCSPQWPSKEREVVEYLPQKKKNEQNCCVNKATSSGKKKEN